MPAASRRVVLSGNSWHITAFRTGLIRELKLKGYEPVILAPLDSAGEARIADLGVELIAVKIDRAGLNPLSDLRLLLGYRRILKHLQPVAYLGFTIKPNIYGCIAARQAGVPAIANINGLGTAFIRRGPLFAVAAKLYRIALTRAAVVFFQNPDDRALFLEQRLVRPEQARLLPGSGVDLVRFAPAPLPQGPTNFLFLGRLIADKGIRELVAAARALREERRDIQVQLIGPLDEGNRTAVARAELQRWVADGAVGYLGETDDIRPFIADATAVVLPSYREGLSRSLLEAGAMARPLIATDVPGCRDLVEDGVNGFLCRPADAASLAEAMRKLADLPPERRSAMGLESRRKIEQRFSEVIVIAAYLDALGKLGGSRS